MTDSDHTVRRPSQDDGLQNSLVEVLVPLTSADLGGSQLFLLKLIGAMPETFRFSVWLFQNGPMVAELQKRGIPHCILPRTMTRTPWGLWRLRRKLKDAKPDVIYLHASRMIALLARQLRIPCVERINMTRKREVGGWCNRLPWLDRIMTEWNTKVIAVSDAIRQQLLGRGVSDDKIEVIRNFVDVERFHRPELRGPTRLELAIPEDAIVVLNVGRMVPQKGQADFIEVANRCLPDNERLHFLLVGDGPLEEDLKAQANKLGLDETGRFRILPFQKDIERIYAASDILLHTAHWDPLANVLLEAMAAELVVVATDIDGTREAIPEPKCGSLFALGDIKAASNILQNVVAQTGEAKVIGGNAFNYIQKHFSTAQKTEEFIRIFMSVDFDKETQLQMRSIRLEDLFSYYIAGRAKRNRRRDRAWIVRKLTEYKNKPALDALLIAAVGRYRIKGASTILLNIIKGDRMTPELMDIAIPAAIRLGIEKQIPEAIKKSYQNLLGWHGSEKMPDPYRILDKTLDSEMTK